MKQLHTPRSKTLTSGNIKELAADISHLKIRGAAAVYPKINLNEVSAHGHGTFHSDVNANLFTCSGSCVIKGDVQIREIKNTGNLKLKGGHAEQVHSSGKLHIQQSLKTDSLDVNGSIHAKSLHTKHARITLSGESIIDELYAEEVSVKKNSKTFSIFKKRLRCRRVAGKRLMLTYTEADTVTGHTVEIGKHCSIGTLYYQDGYTISPGATVKQIIRRNAE